MAAQRLKASSGMQLMGCAECTGESNSKHTSEVVLVGMLSQFQTFLAEPMNDKNHSTPAVISSSRLISAFRSLEACPGGHLADKFLSKGVSGH
mmetsp:Transcript_28238/g.46906  ORF Transcript_28238/g.46906 Transcript_28238/m.46906 type:complete len:93 (-) Transcript_28238:41-319(-)